MRPALILTGFLISSTLLATPPLLKITASSPTRLVLDLTFEPDTRGDLDPVVYLIGLPANHYPDLEVTYGMERSFGQTLTPEDAVGWIQKQRLQDLYTASLEVSPVASATSYYSRIQVTVTFPETRLRPTRANRRQERLLASRILNWDQARNWIQALPPRRGKILLYPPGDWIRFSLLQDGVYTLIGSSLLNLDEDLAERDPRQFRLYTGSNLGRARGWSVEDSIPANLVEIALEFSGEEDGRLDPDDVIRFYGRGPSGFDNRGRQVDYHQNLYFNSNTYWLLIPEGESRNGTRITTQLDPPPTSTYSSSGLSYRHQEQDLINPFQSGLGWVTAPINHGSVYVQTVTLNQPDPNVVGRATVGFMGGEQVATTFGSTGHRMRFHLHSTSAAPIDSVTWTSLGLKSKSFVIAGEELDQGVNRFYFQNVSPNTNSKPFFDYLTLAYGRQLGPGDEAYEFFAPIHSNAVKFTFDGSVGSVWNITDSATPVRMQVKEAEGGSYFEVDLPRDTLDRFVVFEDDHPAEVSELVLVGEHSFSRLRNHDPGVEHLIIGPEEFRAVSAPLVKHRGSSRYVDLDRIYTEFAAGNRDPTAIRTFIRWTQENWSEPRPTYALLMGDGDYDYRNISGKSTMGVPTVEVGVVRSYATDDRLAAVDGVIPALALGRFPARSVSEVEAFVAKLVELENEPLPGLWRQRVTLVADDPARPENRLSEITIGQSHTRNSERLAGIVPGLLEAEKLYLIEYPEEGQVSLYGVTKPAATRALLEAIREGRALINFIGHGSAHQWAQEELLVQDRDLERIQSGMKLPIWIAGTCNWGHFDLLDRESFAEELIRQPTNGAAAVITTTRGITVTGNIINLDRIFRALFPAGMVSREPLGVILQSVKTGGSAGELFHLFGDPALHLPFPADTVSITALSPDTLRSLETGRYSGHQSLNPGGEGQGYVTLVDADRAVTRSYNFLYTQQEISYSFPGATLFRGQFSFTGDSFTGQVRVPKDISYSTDPARLRIYLLMEDHPPLEGLGYRGGIHLAGGQAVSDEQGPIIGFETGDQRVLRSGDHIPEGANLVIRLSDPLGINQTGELGHEIQLTDLVSGEEQDLTPHFIYDVNSITTGTVTYPLEEETGSVALAVKAWDNSNNPAQAEIRLKVVEVSRLKLYHVLNFPNPFPEKTQFTFEISTGADVTVDIFTLEGRRIKSIATNYFSTGYHTIDWDGRDEYGNRLANGVYLYRFKASNGEETVTAIGKLAKYQ